MKYWQEYYLVKHIEKHFGRINIGGLDKIISCVCLKLLLGVDLMCACCPSGMVDMEAKAPHETCTYVVDSCIHRHHVLKDFWTPVINEVLVCTYENEIHMTRMQWQ